MKRFLIGVVILIGVLLVAAVAIPFFIPMDVYKQQIQAATSKALDREVTLEGDVHLSLIPRISVGVDGLTVANEEGFDGDYLIKAGELRAAVKLIPLLSRKVEVAEVSFVDADVNLIRKADGSVNWNVGASPTESAEQETGSGDFDAGVDRARLINSSLTYRDEVEDLLYTISEVNASGSMTGLDKPFNGKIDGLFQDQAFDGRFEIDLPRAFLDQTTTKIDAKFGIANASVAYDGDVTFGEVPTLSGSFEAEAGKLNDLMTLLDLEIAGSELINQVKLRADVAGDQNDLSLTDISFKHSGDAFDATYTGSASLKDDLAGFNGQFSFDSKQLQSITNALAIEIEGVDLLEDVQLSGNAVGQMSLSETNPDLSVDLSNLDAAHKGKLFNATYQGAGGLKGETSSFDGQFSFKSSSLQTISEELALEINGVDILDRVDVSGRAKGTATGTGLDVSLSGLDARHEGSMFEASYKGSAGLQGEITSFNGDFSFKSDKVGTISERMALDIDGAELLDAVDVAGQINGTVNANGAGDLALTGFQASHRGDAFTGNYNGDLALQGETPVLDGRFAFETTDLAGLAKAFQIEASGIEALERVNVSGTVRGDPEALSITGLDAKTTGRLLTASFTGDVSTVGSGSVSGDLSASSDDLRGLMTAADIELTQGETLKSFNIGGKATGSLEQMKIALTTAKLDDMTATGTIELDTRGNTPMAIINAETDTLDLTPFMAPDPNAELVRGWSKDRFPLESLKLVNSRFDLKVDRLILDKTVLTDAKLNGTLTNGNLEVRMPDFKTFGGRWNGTFDLMTSLGTPTMNMNFTGSSIQVERLVKTFTGIDRISGAGTFQFKADARGNSLYELANSLNGNMSTKMGEGIIRGFNASQLLRSREDILGSLTSGNFNLGIGPSAETDFTKLTSILTIRNGVGRFDALEVLNPFMKINGLGTIDIGKQELDINLKFAGDLTGQGANQEFNIAGIGIPLQISGYWLAPRIGPDTDALRSSVTSQVIDRVAPGLGDVVGEDGAGLIRGILGGGQVPVPGQQQPSQQTPSQRQQTPKQQTPTTKPADTTEKLVNDLARQTLGDILGRSRRTEKKKDEKDEN